MPERTVSVSARGDARTKCRKDADEAKPSLRERRFDPVSWSFPRVFLACEGENARGRKARERRVESRRPDEFLGSTPPQPISVSNI